MNEIRQQLRQARSAASLEYRRHASRAIVERIQAHQPFLCAKKIASYYPMQEEVDLSDLSHRASQQQYLPILQEGVYPWMGKGLLFGPDRAPLLPNRFGIPEPCVGKGLAVWEMDYLLVPLLGFDRRGNRIGMGGGYYDRALATLVRSNRRPLKIGVGFSLQEIAAITPQPWDVPLDGIVTEEEFIWLA